MSDGGLVTPRDVDSWRAGPGLRRRPMTLWLSSVMAIGLVAADPAPVVRLRLEARLPCELETTLPAMLAQQQIPIGGEDAAWIVSAERDGAAVVLRVINGQGAVRGLRRLAPEPADCAALPRTAALLVKTW